MKGDCFGASTFVSYQYLVNTNDRSDFKHCTFHCLVVDNFQFLGEVLCEIHDLCVRQIIVESVSSPFYRHDLSGVKQCLVSYCIE